MAYSAAQGSLTPNGNAARTPSVRRAKIMVKKGKANGSTVLEIQNHHAIDNEENEQHFETLPLNGGVEEKPAEVFVNRERTDSECESLDQSSSEHYAKDWTRVAEVFDRLFFWLFLLAILISTLILFHPLTDTYAKKPHTII